MSLTLRRRWLGQMAPDREPLGQLGPGHSLDVVDDNGNRVMTLTVYQNSREYVADTGDTTSYRAFLQIAKDVLVCDERGTKIPIAGVRLQLDH